MSFFTALLFALQATIRFSFAQRPHQQTTPSPLSPPSTQDCENFDNACDCAYQCGMIDFGWSKSSGCVSGDGVSTSEQELLDYGCEGCWDVDNPCLCIEPHCPYGWGWSGEEDDVFDGTCEWGKSTTNAELVAAGCAQFEGTCTNVINICKCNEDFCGPGWGWCNFPENACLHNAGCTTTEAELIENGCHGCWDAPLCECTEENCGIGWGWCDGPEKCEEDCSTTEEELEKGGCNGPSCQGAYVCECTEYLCGEYWGWCNATETCQQGCSTNQEELIAGNCENCANNELCECTESNCPEGWGWCDSVDDGYCGWDCRTTSEELIIGGCECTCSEEFEELKLEIADLRQDIRVILGILSDDDHNDSQPSEKPKTPVVEESPSEACPEGVEPNIGFIAGSTEPVWSTETVNWLDCCNLCETFYGCTHWAYKAASKLCELKELDSEPSPGNVPSWVWGSI